MHLLTRLACLLLAVLIGISAVAGQSIAIVSPDENEAAKVIGHNLSDGLRVTGLRTIDQDMAISAFRSTRPENAFNMAASEARQVAAAIGSNYLLLIKADRLRRTSLAREQYWEAYAAIYLVSSRTGWLVNWSLEKGEADTAELANNELAARIRDLPAKIPQII